MMLSVAPYLFPATLLVASSVKAFPVETFQLSELQTGRRLDDLARILSSSGLLAVRSDEFFSSGFSTPALEAICHCKDNLGQVKESERLKLQDGITERTTLATATAGSVPIALPTAELNRACGSGSAEGMELLRDQVATASSAFIKALDRLLIEGHNANRPLLSSIHGNVYPSMGSIVNASTHLEHFHVYSKPVVQEREEDDTLKWHTDAGLFLAFVPALNCHGMGDEAFFIDTQDTPAEFPPNSVAIMLGAGAEHWIDTDHALTATRHAVKMRPGEERAWYGMMHLVPESAIVENNPDRTFGDMKKAMGKFGGDKSAEISIGCGIAPPTIKVTSNPTAVARRRRLQHVDDGSACNNSTNFYCWMSCLDIPNHENAREYIAEGQSLYCADPAILAASGGSVRKAQEPCYENGILGLAMNSACMGVWYKTSPFGEPQNVKVDASTDPALAERYCFGGTSMYMDGFHWLDSTCVIYLIPSWILDSAGKLAGASIGTVFFAVSMELVIHGRRLIMSQMNSGWKRLGVSAFIYGLQLTMGYLLMLVIMTYSGPLFLSVIIGLMIGHSLFTAQDAVFRRKSQKPSSSTQVMDATTDSGSASAYSQGSSCCEKKDEIPEGFTPCCQNQL